MSTPASSAPYETGSTGSSSGGAKEQAKQTAGTAADEGQRVAGVASGEAKKVASEASSQVHGLLNQATSQVEDQSRTQRDRLADTLGSLGSDLHSMADTSGGGLAADLAKEVGDRAQQVSQHLQGREPRELLDDLRSFARRRPGVFLGGALVAGIVAGRLTRGARDASHDDGTSGYDTGGYDTGGYGTVPGAPVATPPSTTYGGTGTTTSGPLSPGIGDDLGTAAGTPLAGSGYPDEDPVYPSGTSVTDAGRDLR